MPEKPQDQKVRGWQDLAQKQGTLTTPIKDSTTRIQLQESNKIRETLDQEILRIWEESLEKVVIEMNILRNEIGLDNLPVPNLIFVKSRENDNFFYRIVADFNGRQFQINSNIPLYDNLRTIIQMIAHETTHFGDRDSEINFERTIKGERQKFTKFFSGVMYNQLEIKLPQNEFKPYLKQKIILNESGIDEIKTLLLVIREELGKEIDMEWINNQKFVTIVDVFCQVPENGEIARKVSPNASNFLNHNIDYFPDKSFTEICEMVQNPQGSFKYLEESASFLYEENGLVGKANQENWLNEGLCDLIGSVVADKILGELELENQNKDTMVVGYPKHFWKIRDFYNLLNEKQKTEFVNCVLLSKQKYSSVQPIRQFLKQIFINSENPHFARNISVPDLFSLQIFEKATKYLKSEI